MVHVVVLTGAGMSADSGLKTFRDEDGLWEGHEVEKVATPQAWKRNKEFVLNFYNERRKQTHLAEPHAGHNALAKLEEQYMVTIITQNVDDLHERAGSSDVLHLHGEISKVRSEKDPSLIYEIGGDSVHPGDIAEDGSQLRPHVVWFGELVPNMKKAANIVPQAEILIVIGTSLAVYPAAGLTDLISKKAERYIIDPDPPAIDQHPSWHHYMQTAAEGTPALMKTLLDRTDELN